MEHLCVTGPSGHTDQLALPGGAAGGRTSGAGDWLYFVTIDAEGTTLFTADYNEHLANIELAKKNGILDSAR